ncbi:hypothetical protein KZ820_19840 [Sphingomonas sp. RRHST34]|jgi:hypothetical protein|uniref:Lipoprotein n=1 Tax=Sphingomonas citri TaxID=2862499 RepID=A0ABS7BTT4_9SPHN|nr:hypothetical protein [Sphingomonas citri]MBW6533001.1 hypothetical protein [Sphingomonas citri]
MLRTTRAAIFSLAIVALASCSPSERQQTGDDLRSDMPLRDATYYTQHEQDRVGMAGVCEKWKASQRPPSSWPSVVVNNCNNVDTANQLIQSKKDRDEFKKGMGI